jgi:hypothetical protein
MPGGASDAEAVTIRIRIPKKPSVGHFRFNLKNDQHQKNTGVHIKK